MTAGPRNDSSLLPSPRRALRAWIVGVLVLVVLCSVAVLAWSRVAPADPTSSRTITDIELGEDATIRPVPDAEPFRPVLRRVQEDPAPRARATPRTGIVAGSTGGSNGGGQSARPNGGGPSSGGGGGGSTVRPPSNDGGGGGTAAPPAGGDPTPVAPAPEPVAPTPAVPVVTLPPTAVGPVNIPFVAVGPQGVAVGDLAIGHG